MTTTPSDGGGWQRLDPRMLLVHPLRELARFLPVLVGIFVAGAASGGMDPRWQLAGVAVPVLLGRARYLTTSYRVTEERVELRRGLVDRHLLSARLDRVRTVDLTATPAQRLLGLTKVRVGTGTASTSEEDELDLDGLTVDAARSLRAVLLVRAASETTPAVAAAPARVVLRLDLRWVRYAPLTSSGLALGAAVVAVASQVLEALGPGLEVELAPTDVSWWLLPPVLLGLAAVVSALAVGGYLMTNWGFTLWHEGGSWHLRRGLLTTRETTLDEDRVSGVTVGEPIGLRLAGGGRLSAIVTGLDRGQQGSSVLVPPAPRAVVEGVAAEVLGTPGPVVGPLTGPGPRAAARRLTRAVGPALVVTAAVVLLVVAAGAHPGWLAVAVAVPVAAAALGADRARALGHALADGHLVARSGSLYRRREALAVEDVIGWTFRASWFQRRAGLTTLVATTAGGRQAVTVLDVPEERAVEVAAAASPALLREFTA